MSNKIFVGRVTSEEKLLRFCKTHFDFNPITGSLSWKKLPHKRSYVELGTKITNKGTLGYLGVGIKRKRYKQHRIAFLMTYGYIPKYVDHINGIKDDNRIVNLRGCTTSQNGGNRRISSNNKSGFKGVTWSSRSNKWKSSIRVNGNGKHLGYFSNLIKAAEAYNKAAIKYFGEFANLNKRRNR